jgi:hypothetical protein
MPETAPTSPSPEKPAFAPLPPNSVLLSVRPAEDGVHTFIRLTYDATALSERRQRLLAHWLNKAMGKLLETVKKLPDAEVRRDLERFGSVERDNKPN